MRRPSLKTGLDILIPFVGLLKDRYEHPLVSLQRDRVRESDISVFVDDGLNCFWHGSRCLKDGQRSAMYDSEQFPFDYV